MNNLSKHLLSMQPEQTDRLLKDIDLAPLDARTEQRIAMRIRQKRAAAPVSITSTKKRSGNPMRKHALAWLSAAASLLLILGVLSIPGVSRALYSLLHPDFESEKYMMEIPEERAKIPEVEEAIAAASPNGDLYYVELLGEYSGNLTRYDTDYNENIPNLRREKGFPTFDKEAFSFLRDLVPEAREVLYDGHSLTVNTYFHSDHAADFLSTWEGVNVDTEYNLDMTCFDYFIKINGQATTAYNTGYGSGTALSIGSKSDAEIEQLEGFWHTLEISPLPEKLPDGEVEMTILYYIYDADVDDMGAVGNIGRVVHTFTFDATEGNQGEITESRTQFHGEAVMTFWDWENDVMYNRTMQLEDLELITEAKFGNLGIKVNIKAEPLPQEWNCCNLFAGDNDGRSPGIGFDLYLDGTFVKSLSMLDSALNEANFELPIFPSEYSEIQEIVLRPSATYIPEVRVHEWNPDAVETSAAGEEEGTVQPLEIDGEKIFMRGGASWNEGKTVPLTGCDIVIPLPK